MTRISSRLLSMNGHGSLVVNLFVVDLTRWGLLAEKIEEMKIGLCMLYDYKPVTIFRKTYQVDEIPRKSIINMKTLIIRNTLICRPLISMRTWEPVLLLHQKDSMSATGSACR